MGIDYYDPVYMKYTLNLNEDESFTLGVDFEKYKADTFAVVTNHFDDIRTKKLERNGQSLDDLEDTAKASSYEM